MDLLLFFKLLASFRCCLREGMFVKQPALERWGILAFVYENLHPLVGLWVPALRGTLCPKSTCSLPIYPLSICSCPGSLVHLFHALTLSFFPFSFSFSLLQLGFWPPAPICPQSAPSLLALLFLNGPSSSLPPLFPCCCCPSAASE